MYIYTRKHTSAHGSPPSSLCVYALPDLDRPVCRRLQGSLLLFILLHVESKHSPERMTHAREASLYEIANIYIMYRENGASMCIRVQRSRLSTPLNFPQRGRYLRAKLITVIDIYYSRMPRQQRGLCSRRKNRFAVQIIYTQAHTCATVPALLPSICTRGR